MAGEQSEGRRDELTEFIERLEADLSEAKRERRAIEGGFGRGRSRVDPVWDADIARRYKPVAGRRDLVGELAKELDIPVHRLSRIAKRDAAYQAKNPEPVQVSPEPPEAEPAEDPLKALRAEWFEAVNYASRTLVRDIQSMLRAVRKRQWPELESGIVTIEGSMVRLQELAKSVPKADLGSHP